jgi:hypothetical protein
MPTSFDRSFSTVGPLSLIWLENGDVPFSPAALHHLVVSTGLLKASHARSAGQTSCKSDPSLQYWKSPTISLPILKSSKVLNPSELVPLESRLAMLRADPVGCILMVVQLISVPATTPPPSPVIMLVAVPSLTTIGLLDKDDETGILLANIWHYSILAAFGAGLDPEIAHRPLLAAIEGLSREVPTPTMQAYLDEANPLFFPVGELTCSTITLDPSNMTYRAFLLPETCSPPLGLAWPINIGFTDFVHSINALGKAYKNFLFCIKALTSALTVWFPAALANPDAFFVQACWNSELLEHSDKHKPSILSWILLVPTNHCIVGRSTSPSFPKKRH